MGTLVESITMETSNDKKLAEKNFTFNERSQSGAPSQLPPKLTHSKTHGEGEHKHNVSESMLALSRSRKDAFSMSHKGSFRKAPGDSISRSILQEGPIKRH